MHELGHTVGLTHLEPTVCTVNGVRGAIEHTRTSCALAAPYYTLLGPMSGNWFAFAAPQKVEP